MCDGVTIVRDAQREIRKKLIDRKLSLKLVASKSGIPLPTLSSYFPGNERTSCKKEPAQLPAGALHSLCGALPDDLLNLLMPDGFAIVRVPDGVDYDQFSEGCREFLAAKDRAHHPESEAGRDIGPSEADELDSNVARLRA